MSYRRVEWVAIAVALGVALAAAPGCNKTTPSGAVYFVQSKAALAEAVIDGLGFSDSEVVSLAIPDPENKAVSLFPADQVVALEPGSAGIMALEVDDLDGDPVVATLLQFEGANDTHVRVPSEADDDGLIELHFDVSDGICEPLCDIVHKLYVDQAVELQGSGVSRTVTVQLTLDCRAKGHREHCDRVSEKPDDPDPPSAPDRGGRVDAGVAAGGNSGSGGDASGGMGGSGGRSEAGTAGGSGRSSAPMCGVPSSAMCINQDEINLDCIEMVPLTGECAAAGQCCHRASNELKETGLCEDDPLELEYRIAFAAPRNHPFTIGDPLLIASGTARLDQEQQSTLWRFKAPRRAGKEISGAGELTTGVGRYNCDGTYSFYSAGAAPMKPGVSTDVARWRPTTVKTTVDVTKVGRDRIQIAFADNLAGRQLKYVPFLDDSGTALDWEQVEAGMNILAIDVTGEGRDCIGTRSGPQWVPGGTFETYVPLAENDTEIWTLIGQTYCQLIAFGILPMDMKTTTLCSTTARCMPGSASCLWKKLPDSLCPSGDAERALFGCHLGDLENVNQEAGYPAQLACTSTAPTSPADPQTGLTGRCCDPLGGSSTLPACNAYRVVQDYVAAAVEITDAPAAKVQEKCLQ